MTSMKFKHYKNGWNLEKWQNECPQLTYKVISGAEIPDWLPQKLTCKFNSAVIASSGNSNTYVGIIMGFRIDRGNIDEHPFVVAFDKTAPEKPYSGFVEHGNWKPGRTTKIPSEMEKLIILSGLTVNAKFERRPKKDFGPLDDLKDQGILNGYEASVLLVEMNRRSNRSKLS